MPDVNPSSQESSIRNIVWIWRDPIVARPPVHVCAHAGGGVRHDRRAIPVQLHGLIGARRCCNVRPHVHVWQIGLGQIIRRINPHKFRRHGTVLDPKHSTVLVPGEISRETPPKEDKIDDARPVQSGLPVISRSIERERLNAYAKISGDDNPLHLDSDFAAATQFGGIIAHGMLTLAWVSEMMTVAHGRHWLQTGSLRVRFKGAAHLGDEVGTWGDLTKEQNLSRTYAVGVRKSTTGQELITGVAGLTIIQE